MKLLSPITNYLSWIIIFLLLSGNIFSQDFDWFNKHKKQQGQSFWVTSFPNTSSISPHNAYLRFNGLQLPYGNWARVFADASHQRGLHLLAADIDSFKIKWDLKLLPRTTTAIMGAGNYAGSPFAWSISYFTIAGHYLTLVTRGVQFNFDIIRPFDGDTTWHTRIITYNTGTGSPYTLNAYRTVASGDSLTATQQDTITNNLTDTAFCMAFGNSGGSTLVSDTTATTCARTDAGLYGGLKNVWIIKSKSGTDTAYVYLLNEGYGDNAYPYVMTASSSLNAFRNFSITDAVSRGATIIQSFLDYDRAGTGSGSSLVAFNGGFSAYDRYDGQWWDSTTNTRITTASKPYYIDTLGSTGFSGVSYFVTSPGMGLNAESYGLGGCLKDSFLIPCGHLNNINKTTVSGLGTDAFGIMKYNINSRVWSIFDATNYPLGTPISDCIYNGDLIIASQTSTFGDSIKGIARTRNTARWDWDSSAWKALDSGVNGEAYMIKAFGNALMIGGNFTASGSTVLNFFGIMRQPYGQWQALGTGASSNVWSIHVTPAGDTVIGGQFETFNGVTVNRVCKWNGTTALAYGSGFLGGIVYTIQSYKGRLYIGGQNLGNGEVFYWDGSTWQTAFGGVTFGLSSVDCGVIDMKIGKVFNSGIQVDSVLVVTGQFTKVGSTICGRQFIYNGRDVIPCPWIDERLEEAVCYNPPNSDTLIIYTIGDNYGVYGVSTQNVFGLKATFTRQ